ncbi:hypothetical protein [Ochrobactrum sp. A-1]|uniref:hypothetical protein n=1 Tax=Ochrobactrum sp. A-1 TaxID=2920940 RepID=UPI001F0A9183|nr:hypothetical protein [Ochrobactrum sp. A-1]
MNNLDIQSASKFGMLGGSAAVKKQTVFSRISSTNTQTATIAARIEALTDQLFGVTPEATGKGGIDAAPAGVVQQAFDDLNSADDNLARIVRAITKLEELLP